MVRLDKMTKIVNNFKDTNPDLWGSVYSTNTLNFVRRSLPLSIQVKFESQLIKWLAKNGEDEEKKRITIPNKRKFEKSREILHKMRRKLQLQNLLLEQDIFDQEVMTWMMSNEGEAEIVPESVCVSPLIPVPAYPALTLVTPRNRGNFVQK